MLTGVFTIEEITGLCFISVPAPILLTGYTLNVFQSGIQPPNWYDRANIGFILVIYSRWDVVYQNIMLMSGTMVIALLCSHIICCAKIRPPQLASTSGVDPASS